MTVIRFIGKGDIVELNCTLGHYRPSSTKNLVTAEVINFYRENTYFKVIDPVTLLPIDHVQYCLQTSDIINNSGNIRYYKILVADGISMELPLITKINNQYVKHEDKFMLKLNSGEILKLENKSKYKNNMFLLLKDIKIKGYGYKPNEFNLNQGDVCFKIKQSFSDHDYSSAIFYFPYRDDLNNKITGFNNPGSINKSLIEIKNLDIKNSMVNVKDLSYLLIKKFMPTFNIDIKLI